MVAPTESFLRDVGARIAELRRQRGLTQEGLARRLEVAAKYVQRVEQGSENLTLRTLQHFAQELQVLPLHLLLPPIDRRPSRAGRPSSRRTTQPLVRRVAPRPGAPHAVPLYTLIAAAGTQGQADLAEIAEWVELPEEAPSADRFVLRVRGDSMQPLIPHDSLVLFRATDVAREHAVVLLERSDPGALPHYLVKRLAWRASESSNEANAELHSLNPSYPPLQVSLAPDSGVRIVAEMLRVLHTTPSDEK